MLRQSIVLTSLTKIDIKCFKNARSFYICTHERETVKSGTGQVQWCMLHQKLLKVADYIMANTMVRSVLIQGMMNIKYSNIWEFNKESSNFRE